MKCSGPAEEAIDLGDALINDELPRGPRRRLLAATHGLISMTPLREDGSGLALERIELPGQLSRQGSGAVRVINTLLDGPGRDIWAGTALYGLDYLERQYVKLIGMEIDGASPNLFQVHPVDGNRAIVERPGAIESCLVDSAGAIMPLASEAGWDERAVDSAVTDVGVWVACLSGLARLEGRRLVPMERWRGQWGPLAIDGHGAVWMLHDRRIHCVAAGRFEPSAQVGASFAADGITTIEAYRGEIVGARRDGIVMLNRSTEGWERIARLDGGRVRALRSGTSGELWVSTYGDGLCRVQADGRVDHWDRGDGLPDPFLGWIGPVDAAGNLWLNSNTGIVRVSIASLDAVAAGRQQGVEARTFRAPECNGAAGAELSDGVFALPTLEGLVLFDTTIVPPPSAPPIVSISDPYIDGRLASSGDPVSGTAELRFDFSAPIFPTASDARLQTRLVGLEESWVDVGDSRTARYPGVHPGTYALEVRARTPESSWSVPVRSSQVEIAPFWYDRAWIRTLVLATGCLGVWWLIRKRTQALARRNRALSFEIEQRELAESHLRASEER
ncbi:MAG: triple tyrosine motif-containing protein, partial [Planctomycetota bacterium]